jgi:hypothetical protein
MKKSIAIIAAPSLTLALSADLLAAVDGGADDIQQQLGSPSKDENRTSSPVSNREPVKPLTEQEKRAEYEKYKDSDTKPMWMLDYKPE